jgi:hypothetical protein
MQGYVGSLAVVCLLCREGHSMRRAAAPAAPIRQRCGAGALRSLRVLPARLSSERSLAVAGQHGGEEG